MIANEHANRHGAVRELLPWFVSGTLEGEELALVREHLEGCEQCREDVAWQQRLRAAPPSPPSGLDPERALARLMARLEPRENPAPSPQAAAGWPAALAARWRALWSGGGGWMPWALAGQGVLIAGLLVQLVPRDVQDYRALSSGAQPAAGQLVVMFNPDARVAEVQGMLQEHGARLVDGPTATGAYVLDVPAAGRSELVAALRASPAVRLAEPLDAGRAP
ncbi:zf-HC2 domain-containing protein [Pseudoduganella namucuonensis]|uniref:Putative zinc-finger n=1 Tax=Pseudoduganella namucuonensis TaxID=1035707 RepID=A0A1I7KTM1_9BURK|nr:zf-HC2 domain-containing protein [Pseudoduganella namucuonensis]SFV00654.1 Putative zinc-finger [Pseudoduganella namucuonensis]